MPLLIVVGCSEGSHDGSIASTTSTRASSASPTPPVPNPSEGSTPTTVPPAPPSADEVAEASDIVLGDEAAAAGPVRDCLVLRVPAEPAIVAAILDGGSTADQAVLTVVRACGRAARGQDLREFQSRLLNGSLGDLGETAVGKELSACQ